MTDVLKGVLLSEGVVAALRTAAVTARASSERLDTQTLLFALERTDTSGHWSQLLLSYDRRYDDERPTGATSDNRSAADAWEGVPLTPQCATALRRAEAIADSYGAYPLPAGILAIALVWDARTGAAQSFVGLEPAELVSEVQEAILGTELEGLDEVVAAADRASAGTDAPRPDEPLGRPVPPQIDPEAERALDHATARLPVNLLRLLFVAGVAGAVFGVLTSAAWTYLPKNDLVPPLQRPDVAAAVPDDATMSRLMGTNLVRLQEGRPRLRVFDSTVPTAYDIRTQVVHGAWAARWVATDGRTQVSVEVVRVRLAGVRSLFVHDCAPTSRVDQSQPVVRAGYVQRGSDAAEYCSLSEPRQTQVSVSALTGNPDLLPDLATRVDALAKQVTGALPPINFRVVSRVPTPYATAHLRRGILLAAIAVPLLWLLPTLLFDRATWQRLRWAVSLRVLRSLPVPGLDIDPFVRQRIWGSAALASAQVCAAVWVLRLAATWPIVLTALAVVGTVLALSALPRFVYLRRASRSRVFAGSRRLLWLVGTVASLLGIGFAVLLAVAANAASSIGINPAATDYEQQRAALLFELLAIPAALLALAPTMLARRLAMRAMRRQPAENQPPILLLRSFADDGRRMRARANHRRALVDRLSLRRWERFEEVVAAALAVQAPVYGVGQVGERLPPPLGAVRRQFSNEVWQERVFELMGQASLICVTVGRSEALLWEIGRIADAGFLSKTIFVFPPTSREEHQKRLATLARTLTLNWADLDMRPSGSWALSVWVPARGAQPQVLRARAQEDAGYDLAIELNRLAVRGVDLRRFSAYLPQKVAPPPTESYPPGRTPVFKPLMRRKAVWMGILFNASAVIAIPLALLTGETKDASQAISLNAGYSSWAVTADPSTSSYYDVLNGSGLMRLNFDKQSGALVSRIDRSTALTAYDGWVYAASTELGTLQAVDVASGRVAWSLKDLPGIRGVVATADGVYVVLPSQRLVRAVDRTTGRTLADHQFDATPWAAADDGKHLFITLVDSGQVAELDPATLTEVGRVPAPAEPTEIASANGTTWVYSATRHAVVAVQGAHLGTVIWTQSELPHIASNGSVLAIEGVEQISTLWPDGHMYRNRLVTRHANDLAVTATGDVVVTTDDEVLLIRASHH